MQSLQVVCDEILGIAEPRNRCESYDKPVVTKWTAFI